MPWLPEAGPYTIELSLREEGVASTSSNLVSGMQAYWDPAFTGPAKNENAGL